MHAMAEYCRNLERFRTTQQGYVDSHLEAERHLDAQIANALRRQTERQREEILLRMVMGAVVVEMGDRMDGDGGENEEFPGLSGGAAGREKEFVYVGVDDSVVDDGVSGHYDGNAGDDGDIHAHWQEELDGIAALTGPECWNCGALLSAEDENVGERTGGACWECGMPAYLALSINLPHEEGEVGT